MRAGVVHLLANSPGTRENSKRRKLSSGNKFNIDLLALLLSLDYIGFLLYCTYFPLSTNYASAPWQVMLAEQHYAHK